MEENIVSNSLQENFPSCQFEAIDFINRHPSNIYIFWKIKNKHREKVLVKQYQEISNKQILNEFNYQKLFYEKSTKKLCPKPIMVDEDNNILAMEYISGSSVKELLLSKNKKKSLSRIINRSALALADFHTVFSQGQSESYEHKLDYFNKYILKNHVEITLDELSVLDELCLNYKCISFIDFSPPNIMVDDKSVYLIDFPNKKRISTPHIDISRFRFYLELLKQHPYFKLLRKNWWTVDNLFQQFLQQYCNNIGIEYNKSDMYVIKKLQKEFAQELKLYYNKQHSIKNMLKKYYLTPFIHEILRTDLDL